MDIKRYGILPWGLYYINRLLSKLTDAVSIEHFYLFAIPVNNKDRIKVPSFIKKNYTITKIKQHHPLLGYFSTPKWTLDFRFEQKTECLILIKKEDPVGLIWLAGPTYNEDVAFFTIRLEKDTAWDFDLVIREKYRKSPAFAVLWEHIFDYLKARKIKWIYSRINAMNIESLNIHKKYKGRILQQFIFVKFRKTQWCVDFKDKRISNHTGSSRKIITPAFKNASI